MSAKPDLKIVLCSPRGFCAGVVRAIDTVERALAIYGAGTIIWIFVLKAVPLTIGYSFMALTFCFVPLLASVFLGEALTLRYALGAALIIGGMFVINS